jgi:glycosyltransferase involved in cell wall biosynthesis
LQLIHKEQRRGAEVFAMQLSNRLISTGHNVFVAGLYDGGLPLSKNSLPVRSLRLGRISKWHDFAGWRSVATLVSEVDPDIVQANAGDTLLYAALSKAVFRWKAPIIYRNASMMSAYLKSRLSKFLYGLLLRKVSGVASVSEITAADLVGLYPFLKDRTNVLPVGVNLDDFREPKQESSTEEINLLHVGGFTFEKNHDGLLRIFNQLSLPNALLHLVGDGPLRKSIEEKVEKLGLSSRVVFHGSISNPFQQLSFANALLLPSIIEGTPAVIMEAFAANIPVIAYNVGAVHSLIEDNVTGYLVESNNETSFVEKVHHCLSQNNDSILENAYDLVVKHYNNEQIADGFVAFYKKILAQN